LRCNIATNFSNFTLEIEHLLKDPAMLKRLNEIEKMDSEDKNHILHVLDGFIKSVKLKNIAAF